MVTKVKDTAINATLTGVLKGASGNLVAAVAGTDYLAPAAIGTTVQAYDADLTSWAGIAPSAKQDTLVSNTNIKTVNSTSLLGSGNIDTTASNLVVTTNTQTISADLTLTTASSGIQVLTSTIVGACIWLPNATGYTQLGGPKFIIKNVGGQPIGVRNNSGTLLGAINGSRSANVWLSANGSADGTWTLEGDDLKPGLVTVDTVLSTTYNTTGTTSWNCWASLTPNISLHAISVAANGFAVVAADSQGKTIGTPLVVESGATTTPYIMFTINSTQAIVFWKQSTNYRCAVLTVSGTTVSMGAVATQTSVDWLDTGIDTQYTQQLSTTLYLHCRGNGGAILYSTAISVSGTTCTIGTTLSTSVTVNCTGAQLYTVSSTTALVLYKKGTGSPYTNCARIISVSGTTCTANTELVTTLTGSQGGNQVANTQLTPTTYVLCDNMGGSSTVDAIALTVSGTTVSQDTKVTVDNGFSSGDLLGFGITSSNNVNSRFIKSVTRLSNTTALLIHGHYSTTILISRIQVLTISAGVVTYGTVLLGTGSNNSGVYYGYGTWLPSTTDGAIAITSLSAGGLFFYAGRRLFPHYISGTNVNVGIGLSQSAGCVGESVTGSSGTVLSSGDYIGYFTDAVGSVLNPHPLYVFRNKNGIIQDRGCIDMPSFGHRSSPTFGTDNWSWPNLVNGTLVLGASSGTGSSETLQLRLVRFEIATTT